MSTVLGPVDNESVLFRCGGHNWCCNRGGNGTSCCGNGGRNLFRLEEPSRVQNGTLNFADGYTLTATADLVSAPANQSLASPAPITTSCVAASTEEAGNDNKVTAVGAGVGVGVGVPLLAALIGVLYLWRKERKVVKVLQTKLAAQQNEHQRKQMDEAPAPEYVDHHIPHELDNPARYAKELPDQSPRSRGL
ncbi:MAG: hypothetical protein LQ344_004640 [Seirophora lacunosa]|nr:MAG: hypothetical protein LQ344_004640 [Seirophora lacunosa]